VSGPPQRLDTAYRPAARLTVVPVADEAAVYDRRNNKLHRLDPIATVVWSRLDGVTTTAALARSLAAEFGAPPEQVSRDVAALLDRLVDEGLVVEAGAGDDADESTDDSADADEDPAPGPHGVRVLHVRRTPCVDAVTALGWHATDPLVVAGCAIGVRTSDEATRTAVRAALPGDWHQAIKVDANLSVRAPVVTDTGLDLGRVYAECTLVGRGRTVADLLDRARREVAGQVLAGRGDALVCEATVLDGPLGLLLAPPWWWTLLLASETRLRAAGWQMRGRHAVLGTGDHSGRLGLPVLGTADDIVLDWLGPVAAVAVSPDRPDAEVTDSPATKLAALAAVMDPLGPSDPAVMLDACAALAADVELVAADTPDDLLVRLSC